MSRSLLGKSPAIRTSLILLAGLPVPLAAQAVFTGRTLNDSTKQPVSGVEIVLEKPATRVETDA